MEAGYLGVGSMGQPMAGKLLDGGHQLTIHDVNEAAMRPLLDRQARRANSPKELADQCEIVFVSLPTLAVFRHIVFGPDGLLKGTRMKILVNTCTVGVPFVKEIEAAMAAKGVTVVDCPISGGPTGSRDGTLSVMGFRQFLLRGLEQVRGEWSLVTMAWNMKRIFALCPAQ